MSFLDLLKKEKSQAPIQRIGSKEDILKEFFEQMRQKTPSDHFVSGAVFDIVRQNHEAFERIVRDKNALDLQTFFAKAYMLFCDQPQIVGFTPAMVDRNKNDTDPRMWNADIFHFDSGESIALCFIPVQHDTLLARIVGIVLSDNGDRYYYCMLNKDTNAFSDVIQNKARLGIEKVGEVRGIGFELMNSFVDVIKH